MPLHQVLPASSCLWSDSDLLINLPRDTPIVENGNKFYRRVAILYDDSPPRELVEGTRKLVEWRELGKPLPQSVLERKSTSERTPAPGHTLNLAPPPSSKSSDRTEVTRSDLERCRHILRTTLRQCSTIEFRAVCCAISCILNSSQPLLRNQVLAATVIHGHKSVQQDLARNPRKPDSQQWLRRCDELLIEDFNGRINFRPKAMSFFLRKFAIPGIDTSHKTIANICLLQRELRQESETADLSTREHSEVVQAADVFHSYATKYGDVHLRTASLKSLPLTRAARELSGKTAPNPQLTLNPKTLQHKQDVSPISEGEDWVLVDESSLGAAEI